jgi:hypothetical protein
MIGRVLKNIEEQILITVKGKTIVVLGVRRGAAEPEQLSRAKQA